ncbi:MAG: hypothetical protein AAFQ40_13075 [Cyanobacteria bacterium J06623_5]
MSAPKILIENQNALGRNVEAITLDTNRVNVQSETTSRLANLIALSSRGIWVDISQWSIYTAAAFAIGDLALTLGAAPWAVLLSLCLPLLILAFSIYSTIQRRKTLAPHGLLRLFLLTLGIAIALA